MKNKRLPDFFLIGAMKSGTSSLHYYLDQHPAISMSAIKEPNYFSKTRSFLHKGKAWYMSLFPDNNNIKGESSTAYTKHPHIQGVPSRIRKINRQAKFIYLLRHPVDRTVSHIQHDMLEGLIPYVKYMDGYIRQKENNIYVDCSRYMTQLNQYLKLFPKENFLILSLEELNSNPEETTDRVFHFLGVEGQLKKNVFENKKNVSGDRKMITNRLLYKRMLRKEKSGKTPVGRADETYRKEFIPPEISEAAVEDFIEDLKPDIEVLYQFIGRKFNWEGF